MIAELDIRIAFYADTGERFVEVVKVVDGELLHRVGPYATFDAANQAADDLLAKMLSDGGQLTAAQGKPLQ